jgi:hypothetical protein
LLAGRIGETFKTAAGFASLHIKRRWFGAVMSYVEPVIL